MFQSVFPRKITQPTEYRCAVAVVDMQERYLMNLWPDDRDRILGTQASVLERCIQHNVPIFNICYAHRGMTVDPIRQLLKEAKHVHDIKKYNDNAFCSISGDSLRRLNIESLFMMGVNASACVYESSLSALKHGFNVITSDDVIADSIEIQEEGEITDKSRVLYLQYGAKFLDTHIEFLESLPTYRNP